MNWINTYITSPTHKWWVDNVWAPSWTRLTTAIYGLPAMLVAAGETISHFANDNTIANYLAQVGVPNWVPMMLAGIALVHYVAHGRE